MNLLEAISNGYYTIADELLKEEMDKIVYVKLNESKKKIACDYSGNVYTQTERQRRLKVGVLEDKEEPKATQSTEQEVSEGIEPGEESSMARSEISAITRDAKTIMSKIKGKKELEAWTQSKITKAADYMNAVANYMEKDEDINESRIKFIKVRIRGGKIQRKRKASNVPGMKIQGGKLTKMSPSERRKRKLGAVRAARKSKLKKSIALRKRKMSLMKRERLGI